MVKKSLKRVMRYEKDHQSGCMRGLISMFDFRHAHSNQKLLSDKKLESWHAVGLGTSPNRFEMLINLDEDCHDPLDNEECTTADAGKPSVKKLLEEEIFREKESSEESTNPEVELEESNFGDEPRMQPNRTMKTHNKSFDMDDNALTVLGDLRPECPSYQKMRQQFIIDHSVEKATKEFYETSIGCVKHKQNGKVHLESKEDLLDLEEKLAKAIKELIAEKINCGRKLREDQKINNSRNLMDVHHISSSGNDVFRKLVQNPNSSVVRYDQNIQESDSEEAKESRSPDGSEVMQKEELANDKRHYFFRRNIKSQQTNPSEENDSSEASTRIVVLKPKAEELQDSEDDGSLHLSPEPKSIPGKNVPSERSNSYFSLMEIKRWFKNVLGKERCEISRNVVSNRISSEVWNFGDGGEGVGKENTGRHSPSKDRIYFQKFTRPSVGGEERDKNSKLKYSDTSKEHDIDFPPCKKESSTNIETKNYLSEMLSSRDKGVDLFTRKMSKTLGRILSHPGYNNFSPTNSSRKDSDHRFPEMRFSARGKFWNENEKTQSPKQENNCSQIASAKSQMSVRNAGLDDVVETLNKNSSISHGLIRENGVEDAYKDEMSPKCGIKNDKATGVNILVQENGSVSDSPSDLSSSCSSIQNGDEFDVCDDRKQSECLQEDVFEKNQLLSSPLASPSAIRKIAEDLENAQDIVERPSPVPVLEPLVSDDDAISRKAIQLDHSISSIELAIQPQQNKFEESDLLDIVQGNSTKACMEGKEVISHYVKSIVHTSRLNWDELCVKWVSSEQLLDLSVCAELPLFPNQLCSNQKLLFDCINEVLMEICQCHSLCLSFIKPSARPILDMRDVIREVLEGVYWHLLQQSLPLTLDQIVSKDMNRTRIWMNLYLDTEIIGAEMSEAIYDDLLENIISSCLHEGPDNLMLLVELD